MTGYGHCPTTEEHEPAQVIRRPFSHRLVTHRGEGGCFGARAGEVPPLPCGGRPPGPHDSP